MKTMKSVVCLSGIVPLFLAGCTSDSDPETGNNPMEIRLNGGIAATSTNAQTRGDGMINGSGIWTNDLSVNFARADADKNGDYTDYLATALSASLAKAPTSGTNHAVTFTPAAYYHSDHNTKLIGWYPASGTFSPTAHTVTYATALDGSTDLMATDLYEGSKVSAIATVTFKHLLTQISVKVYSEDANAASVWGGIKSVKVDGKSQTCVVTLPAATAAATGGTEQATAAFSGTNALDLVKKNPAGNVAIDYSDASPLALGEGSGNAVLAGYAMFAPVADAGSINLTIVTEKGGTKSAKVNAPTGGFAAGTSYVVTLKFSGAAIVPAVSITDWVTGTNPGEIII